MNKYLRGGLRSLFIISLVLLSNVLAGCATDQITLVGHPGGGKLTGLLLDSSSGNDTGITPTNSTVIDVGSLGEGGHNEIVAFTNERAVEVVENVDWDGGGADPNNITVILGDPIDLKAKVWIVSGDVNMKRQDAISACIETARIWEAEGMGIRFKSFEIVDATGHGVPDLNDFDCSEQTALQAAVGEDDGKINIYYVNKVDMFLNHGDTCWIGGDTNDQNPDHKGDFVALGSTTGNRVLAHELGHTFALQHLASHTSPPSGVYGTTTQQMENLMHRNAIGEYSTEGQKFRAHVNGNSAVRNIFGMGTALVDKRFCEIGHITNKCIPNYLRMWNDGTLPPNCPGGACP